MYLLHLRVNRTARFFSACTHTCIARSVFGVARVGVVGSFSRALCSSFRHIYPGLRDCLITRCAALLVLVVKKSRFEGRWRSWPPTAHRLRFRDERSGESFSQSRTHDSPLTRIVSRIRKAGAGTAGFSKLVMLED
jgi:hypothetical protein